MALTDADLAALQAPLRTFLESNASVYTSTSADGGSVVHMSRADAMKQFLDLQAMRDNGSTGGLVASPGEFVSG